MEKFRIIEGEGRPDPLDKLWKIGGAVLGFGQKTANFGVIMLAETGSTLMYLSGQKKYAQDLAAREPKDRITREAKTAQRAFSKHVPNMELGDFALKYIVSGVRAVVKRDIEEVQNATPAVMDLVEKLPNTDAGISIAIDIVEQYFEPIMDKFNEPLVQFKKGIPTQRPPTE